MDNQQNYDSSVSEDRLNTEDKVRIFKGMILIFFFSTVVVTSMVYYNAPNFNPNIVFEGNHNDNIKHDLHSHDFPVYKIKSRYSNSKMILYDLELERKGRANAIDAESTQTLQLLIKFSKNKAYIKIFDPTVGDSYTIPHDLFGHNDLNLVEDGAVDNILDSNLGIKVNNHPFGFYIYRKAIPGFSEEILFDTSQSGESTDFDRHMFIAKNYLQISTSLPSKHFIYGLEERYSEKLRLKPGKYGLYNRDPDPTKPYDVSNNISKANTYGSYPYYMTVNPETQTAYGVMLFNASPAEAIVGEEFITFKQSSGIIELYIFAGPRPKEVVMQLQKTIGLPVLPPYTALNWQSMLHTENPLKNLDSYLELVKEFNVKSTISIKSISINNDAVENGDEKKVLLNKIREFHNTNDIKINFFTKSSIKNFPKLVERGKELNVFIPTADKTDEYFIDHFNPNSTRIIKDILYVMYFDRWTNSTLPGNASIVAEPEKEKIIEYISIFGNEPSYPCNSTCKASKTSSIPLPTTFGDYPLEDNTFQLNTKLYGADNNIMLNTHNLYSLQEVKSYYTASVDLGLGRPMIFTRSGFMGTQQYAGKFLGNLSGWSGLELAVTLTLKFNLIGNPNVVHDACGYSLYDKDKVDNKDFDFQLCVRWMQFAALNPLARFTKLENIQASSKEIKNKFDSALSLRYEMLVYIMSYMISNSIKGGSFLRPMFMDFTSSRSVDTIMKSTKQFMMGSYLMVAPVLEFNANVKKVFFPNDPFYNYDDGTLMNSKGEVEISVDVDLNKIPRFIRSGSLIPYQTVPETVKDAVEMRKLPIQIKIGLDLNMRAYGNVFIDDGVSSNYKSGIYFRMDITATLEENTFIIIFYIYNNRYSLKSSEYPGISEITLFGFKLPDFKTVKIKGEKEPISSNNIKYDRVKNVLKISGILIPFTQETRINIS